MTDKPADHEPSQEARAADTPPAPEARSAEGGTLPLPTEPLPAEESTPLPADEPTPLRTDEPTALSADEPTGHRPAEPVAAHTDADADGTVALEGASGAAESDTAAADPQSTALHSETRDYAADDVTKISAPTSAGEPPTEPLGAAGSTGPVDPAAADSPDEAPTGEFGTVPPPSEFGAAPATSEFGAAPPFGAPGGTGGPPPPPPGGYQPPSGGFPPPPPPPTGGLFATRYGLVRPQNGRWFAGVCAAIGRATNTDPVLWRVLLAVLALFGGVGVLIYAVGWLLIPAEGDSASPAEALIGRGQSSTSALFTLGLAVLAVIMFGVAFSGNIRTGLLGAVVVVGAVLLVSKGKQAGTHGAPPPPTPTPPPPAFTPAASTASNPMNPTSTEPAGGYRPPFAPHGPYASSSPYPGYSPPYPGLDAPVAPPPKEPRRPRERSRLGRVVLSLICLAIGVLVVVDVAVASIAGTAYVAAALGVIGLGLVVGAWVGRARWLILPGLILTAILLLGSSVETWNSTHHGARNITWVPTTVSEIEQNGSYSIDVGNATLDLSKVDFTDHDVAVNTNLDAGNMTVILPPNVDVDVDANVEAGSASVLGQRWDGINHDARHIADQGADGAGGGKLRLNSSVNLGKLEVHR